MAEKIVFGINVPVEVALKFPAGKLVQSNFGDPQYLFTCVDDRVFFVAEKVAEKIHALQLKPRESFEILKAEIAGAGGRRWIEWRVSKLAFLVGEQPDGTFALPAPPVLLPNDATEAQLLRSIEAIKARQRANQTGEGTPAPTPDAFSKVVLNNVNGTSKPQTKLSDALKTAVEAAHNATLYAKEIGYGGMPNFTSEDISKMAMTALIGGRQ